MPQPWLVFAGGGTGGHLYPGLAVAHAVREAAPDARITFFTTDRPLDRDLLAPTGFEQIVQPVRPFTLHPFRWPAFYRSWRRSVADARRRFVAEPPHAVLGLGGYAAGPPVVAARNAGLWTTILNPDAIPGRANRYLARRADLVVLQWEATRRHFPTDTLCEALGCPIRSEFATPDAAAGRQRFGLDPARPVLLVTGASQGARTVNEAMLRVWPQLVHGHPEWQLLHLTGAAHEHEIRAAYAAANVPAQVVGFTHEMWLALAAADVVVSRAGASTLAELTALGKPSVLLPYPYHRDQHQRANGVVLADRGAAILLEDYRDAAANAGPLLAALVELSSTARRAEMARHAREMGRPDAAKRVAAWLLGGRAGGSGR